MSLIKVCAALGAVLVLLFDAGAVLVTHAQADELGQRVLRAVVSSYEAGSRHPAQAEAVAAAAAAEHARAAVHAVVVSPAAISVTVSQRAPVLVLDRIGALDHLAVPTVTKQEQPAGR
jgi:hypothetical protein